MYTLRGVLARVLAAAVAALALLAWWLLGRLLD